MKSNRPIVLDSSDGEHGAEERSSAAGVGLREPMNEGGEFEWADFEGDMKREIKRERTAAQETRTALVLVTRREGSAPPELERVVDVAEHEASAEDEMDDLFDTRVQTLTEGIINTKDLRCVSCFVRYADVGVFPCGHVCT